MEKCKVLRQIYPKLYVSTLFAAPPPLSPAVLLLLFASDTLQQYFAFIICIVSHQRRASEPASERSNDTNEFWKIEHRHFLAPSIHPHLHAQPPRSATTDINPKLNSDHSWDPNALSWVEWFTVLEMPTMSSQFACLYYRYIDRISVAFCCTKVINVLSKLLYQFFYRKFEYMFLYISIYISTHIFYFAIFSAIYIYYI